MMLAEDVTQLVMSCNNANSREYSVFMEAESAQSGAPDLIHDLTTVNLHVASGDQLPAAIVEASRVLTQLGPTIPTAVLLRCF